MMLFDVNVSVMTPVMFQYNKTAKEIFNSALQEACGTYTLSYSQVTRWVNEFKNSTAITSTLMHGFQNDMLQAFTLRSRSAT